MRIELVFPGKPISKDNRATIDWAFTRGRRRRPIIRIPENYRRWEERIQTLALAELVRDPRFPIKQPVPIEAWITFFYPYWPSRPDLHNAPKSFCDALNKVVWQDDSQIWDSHLRKRKDVVWPRIEIQLRVMDRKEIEGANATMCEKQVRCSTPTRWPPW